MKKSRKPTKDRPKKLTKDRLLSSLKSHPRQREFFPDDQNIGIDALAEDIKKNGLINPIEIMSDGTIIAGHRRVLAAKSLAKKKIRCWVRDDLETEGKHAVERRLIEDNLNRRQMSKLATVRCIAAQVRLEQNQRKRGVAMGGDLRDIVGKRLGISGRNLERYVRVAETPLEVQQAFEAGHLPLVKAAQVANLPDDIQARIAKKIGKLDDKQSIKQVVENYVGSTSKKLSRLKKDLALFVADLKRGHKALNGKISKKDGHFFRRDLEVLRPAGEMVDELVRHLEGQQGRIGKVVKSKKRRRK